VAGTLNRSNNAPTIYTEHPRWALRRFVRAARRTDGCGGGARESLASRWHAGPAACAPHVPSRCCSDQRRRRTAAVGVLATDFFAGPELHSAFWRNARQSANRGAKWTVRTRPPLRSAVRVVVSVVPHDRDRVHAEVLALTQQELAEVPTRPVGRVAVDAPPGHARVLPAVRPTPSRIVSGSRHSLEPGRSLADKSLSSGQAPSFLRALRISEAPMARVPVRSDHSSLGHLARLA